MVYPKSRSRHHLLRVQQNHILVEPPCSNELSVNDPRLDQLLVGDTTETVGVTTCIDSPKSTEKVDWSQRDFPANACIFAVNAAGMNVHGERKKHE